MKIPEAFNRRGTHMKRGRDLWRSIAPALLLLSAALPQAALAQLLTLSNIPLYVGANVQPLVMLTLSKDQQLYKKAYNDYTDLDPAVGDGLELTYKHSINYYGYFDPGKCYDYDTANTRFTPFAVIAAADNKYCIGGNAGKWSGNFLNWSTMTRMDAVRKLLYGGLRQTDTTGLTVLERSYLPTDAHSFAKWYNGADLSQLTPFAVSGAATTTAVTSASFVPATGQKTFTFAAGALPAGFAVGDQVQVVSTLGGSMTGVVSCTNIGGTVTSVLGGSCATSNTLQVDVQAIVASVARTAWTLTNFSRQGLTICNTTLGGAGALGVGANASPQNLSTTNTNPPLIRVAQGDFGLWAANERWQCLWRDDSSSPGANDGSYGGVRNNGNQIVLSGVPSSTFSPLKATHGLGSIDYVARVVVCDSTKLGTEKCKQYPSNNFKPIGLLQTYGDPGLLQFGLMTGSYTKNVSGGVLRKNTGVLTDEINVSTDGTFQTASLVAAFPGIINTLNRMRIAGYSYTDGTYIGADSCGFQLTSITEGNCSSWGNPMSEIYYEAIRYLAGGGKGAATSPSAGPVATTAYGYGVAASLKDNALGLPQATWVDPLSQNTYCAPLNTVVMNTSVSTNDDTQAVAGSLKTTLNLANLAGTFSSALASQTIVGWGDVLMGATGENIIGGTYFVGRSGANINEYCDGKAVTSIGSLSGICPEGPTLAGSYYIAGMAYAAHINRIRGDLTVPATNTTALKVDTYAVQLATNVPQVNVTLQGATTPLAIIQPAYRLFNSAPQGGGSLVDLKFTSLQSGANFAKGSMYLNWEDSEQGGDYDLDMWGVLSWCAQTNTTTACPGQGLNTISVTTRAIAAATANPQGFGYIISGTTKNGPHFHSGILGFTFTDPQNISVPANQLGNAVSPKVNASGGCGNTNCQVRDPATTAVYALGGTTAGQLADPLLYAAKWGGFKESGTGGNNLPDLTTEWDIKDSSGAAGSDGIPDNYFLVSNPLGLETALDKAFVAILTTSSASSVATNSTSLNSGSRIYQARFNSNDWSGQLLSFTIDTNGVIASAPEWDAGQNINSILPANRNIATIDQSVSPPVAIPFRWASLNTAQQTLLNTGYAGVGVPGVNDGKGSLRLDYLRGDGSNEGFGINNFRRRINSKLGDIVNSNPQFVGAPNGVFSDGAYVTFKTTYANRPPMIYVGANDGMLHGFDGSQNATKGNEVFAYIPGNVYYKLPWLTSPAYPHRYFVDGTPQTADVYINGRWRTILVSTQAAGGQSLLVLDITDPTGSVSPYIGNKESNANSWVLFEFRDIDESLNRIGNIFGQPQIAKMQNGKWAIIVGNGYNHSYACSALPCPSPGDYFDTASYSFGRANMYVFFIEDMINNKGSWVDGTHYIHFNTLQGSGATPNGFTPPTLLDTTGNGTVDYIYAGDLLGNLFKFDVTSSIPGNWGHSFGGTTPFYRALDPSGNPQIITAPPVVGAHPQGGYMVLFGTGRYLQPTDPNPPYTVNTFYGLWDKQAPTFVSASINPSAGPIATSVSTRNSALLQQQTFIGNFTNAQGINFRVTSQNIPDWTTQRGWYLDFPSSATTGERSVVAPLIRSDKAIITSLIPSTTSCDAGGTGFLTDLDAVTGGRLNASPFDVNGDRNFTTGDQVSIMIGGVATLVYVSSRQSQVGITPTPTVISGGVGREFKVTSGSTGGRESVLENPGGASASTTRRFWREILTN